MQNERVDNTENNSDDLHDTDKVSEMPENNETNLLEDATKNSDIDNELSTKNEEDVTNPAESLETASLESPNEKVADSPGGENKTEDEKKDEENVENEESKNDKEDNESAEMAATVTQDEEPNTEVTDSKVEDHAEWETPMNPTPPPKPPRLKSGNSEDISNEKELSSKEDENEEKEGENETKKNNEQSSNPQFSDKKSKSAISRGGIAETIDAIENSIEKVQEDGYAEKPEKVETDGAQDDADVVQSPAPRTGGESSYLPIRKNKPYEHCLESMQ